MNVIAGQKTYQNKTEWIAQEMILQMIFGQHQQNANGVSTMGKENQNRKSFDLFQRRNRCIQLCHSIFVVLQRAPIHSKKSQLNILFEMSER